MARPHTILRTIIALVLLGVLVGVFSSLGRWQLDRAAQRDAIKQTMEAGRQRAPIQLEAGMPGNALAPWQAASARGHWRHDLTVLLENRNYQGRPGYWVATPLLLDAPAMQDQQEPQSVEAGAALPARPATPATAVLVLRGWLPRPMQTGQAPPAIPAPQGLQTVHGELLERVPRLFELWSWSDNSATRLPAHLPDPGRPMPSVQNLDLQAYSAATGLKFMPIVLAQTPTAAGNSSPGAGENTDHSSMALLQDWPEPSLDSDKNRGYALQWYGFAAIAGIAWLVIVWRLLRRRSGHRNQ